MALFIAGGIALAIFIATGQPAATTASAGGDWILPHVSVLASTAQDEVGAIAASLTGDLTNLEADCRTLSSDAAQTVGAIPDATAQSQFTSLMAQLTLVGQECSNGAQSGNQTLIDQSLVDLRSTDSTVTALEASFRAMG